MTVGYASGVIPKIPLNLVLLKGIQILGFQFIDFAMHAPDELRRNEQELLELFASHRVEPHIGASFELADAAARCASGRCRAIARSPRRAEHGQA